MSYTLVLEGWIRLVATVLGLLAISLPLLRLWLNRSLPAGRASQKRISLTRWSGAFILTILYIAIGIRFWVPISLDISTSLQFIMVITGSILYFPGIALYLWGFMTIGSLFGVSSAASAQLYDRHHLVERGPYSFVRHPMYLGVILVALGALLIFRTWAMVLFTPTAFTVILRARREEELLAKEFDNSWADYCRRVPAWIPRFTHKS
jgi:protein-S-isoprenylcysteine O-methyltransferase Ste14